MRMAHLSEIFDRACEVIVWYAIFSLGENLVIYIFSFYVSGL